MARVMNKLPRASSEADRLALKAAVRASLKLAGGGDAFALSTRLEAPQLSGCASAMDAARHLPLDVALDLDREAGAPVIASALAALLGHDLVRRGEAASRTCTREADAHESRTRAVDATPLDLIGHAARELGDVMPALLAALADGGLDAAERRQLNDEIAQAMKALVDLHRFINPTGHAGFSK